MMRQMNQRALLQLLQRHAVLSRAQLAKSSGMSQPTAGKIVDDMLAAGWITTVSEDQSDSATNRPGRPAHMVALDHNARHFLTIQLGVVHTRLEMVSLAAPRSDHWSVRFLTPDSQAVWASRLRIAARSLGRFTGQGVLLSVPGVVDESSSRILFSPNAHWTEGVDLPAIVSAIWHKPVAMIHEIRALTLGQLAVDPPSDNFLLIDIGAGMGSAAVIDGRLNAPLPLSGELGHTMVSGNSRRCGCGATGCVETLVSRRGLLRSFSKHTSGPTDWKSLKQYLQPSPLPQWLTETLDAAAIVIAGGMNVLGASDCVITGSISELPSTVGEHLCKAIEHRALAARFGEVSVILSPRRRQAGLIAAGIDRLLLNSSSRQNNRLNTN